MRTSLGLLALLACNALANPVPRDKSISHKPLQSGLTDYRPDSLQYSRDVIENAKLEKRDQPSWYGAIYDTDDDPLEKRFIPTYHGGPIVGGEANGKGK